MPRPHWLSRKRKGGNVEANPSLPTRAQQIDVSSSALREQDRKKASPQTILTDGERAARAEKAKDSSTGKGLWEAAYDKIDRQRLNRLQIQINDGDETSPEGLQDVVKQKINEIKDSRLKLKLRNGEVLQIRDGAMKVIKTILSYKDIVTAAVAAETQASLAWGGITALLTILSTALSQTDNALKELDGISTLLVQYRVIEVTYDLSEIPEERFRASDHIRKLHSQLRDQTIELYKQILEHQIDLMDHFAHSKSRRTIQNIPAQALGNFSKIQEASGDALKTLQIMDSVTIVDVDRQLVPLRSDVKGIMDRMSEVHKNVKDLAKENIIKGLHRVHSAAFDDTVDGEVLPSCFENTRTNTLEKIRAWAYDASIDANRVFWLSGMAGTGKSTVARTIAHELDKKGQLGASFFFSRVHNERARSENFFSTLALDLAAKAPGFDECLYQSIPKYEDLRTKSLKDQWDHLILQPLKALGVTLLVPLILVVIIDALDECKGNTAVPEILKLFLEVKDLRRIHLRIFLTSRNEDYILQQLERKPGVTRLSLEKETDTRDDISRYVRDSLTQIATSKELEQWPEENEIQELLQWSGHLFIAAATACRYLRLGSFPEDTLREFLEAKRTMDDDDPLDNMYNLLLQSAAAAAAGPDKKRFAKLYPLVVGAILVSKEPMSRRDMEEMLGLSTREIDFILNHLLCVLIVPQERQAAVRLFHLSFRDYLMNRERCQDLRFFIDESEAHKRSFEYCFGHLSSGLKENIHQYHPGTPISEMSQHKVSRVIQYCSQYWVAHLTEAGENSLDAVRSKRILEFLHAHLLHWIEICAIIGRIDDAVNGIENLKVLASRMRQSELESFVKDAHRFILYHRSIIEEAPLQVYYMAAIFTPAESLTRKKFSNHFPEWLYRSPTMESGWGVEQQAFTLGSTIHTSAVSFDEKLAAISTECEVHVWNLTTGKLEHVMSLRNSGNLKHYLKFSRTGTELYALLGPSLGKLQGEWILKGWSLVTGNALTRFTDEESSLLSLGDLSSWNLEHDHCLSQKGDFSSRPINASEWAKLRLAISPDWSTIALFHGKCAHIANPQTRCIIRTLMFPTEESDMDTIAISATKVAIGFKRIRGSMHQLIKFYDIENDTEQDLQLGKGFIVCWALSYDGSRLVSFMSSRHFEIWDLYSNQLMYSIDFGMTFTGGCSTLALLPQSNKFLTGYRGSARLWDLEQQNFPLKDRFTWTLSLNIDGTKILIQRWGLDQLETLQILDLVKGGFIPLPKYKGYRRFDSNHGLVLHREHLHQIDKTEDTTQGVWIWSLKAERSHLTKGTFVPTSLEMESFAVAVSSNGTRLAIISQYGEHDNQTNSIIYWVLLIEIWELHEDGVQCHLHKTVKYVTKLRDEKPNSEGRMETPVLGANFSPDGTRLVICSRQVYINLRDADSRITWNSYVTVFCVENGGIEHETYLSAQLLCAALSHDSNMVAIGSIEGVDICENGHDQAKKKLSLTHDGNPTCLAFSTQDTKIAVGWDVGEVCIYMISSGQTQWVSKLEGLPSLARLLKYSPDDSWIEEPFYTLDRSRKWILHGNKKLLALPRRFQGAKYECDFTNVSEDCRSNTIAFFCREHRPVSFLFNGPPNL